MEFDVSDMNEEFQRMIRAVGKMEDEVKAESAKYVREAGEIIAKEQRRLISAHYPTLASFIDETAPFVNSKGTYKIRIGYSTDAIKAHPEGVIIEFGRPGVKKKEKNTTSLTRRVKRTKRGRPPKAEQGETTKLESVVVMMQNRNNKEVKVKIGEFKFGSISHIRKGYDNSKEDAYQYVLKKLEEVLKEWESTN